MKYNLVQIELDCGKYTCSRERGSFCSKLGSVSFGTKRVCMLFPSKEGPYTPLLDSEGVLVRCDACMYACGTTVEMLIEDIKEVEKGMSAEEFQQWSRRYLGLPYGGWKIPSTPVAILRLKIDKRLGRFEGLWEDGMGKNGVG